MPIYIKLLCIYGRINETPILHPQKCSVYCELFIRGETSFQVCIYSEVMKRVNGDRNRAQILFQKIV